MAEGGQPAGLTGTAAANVARIYDYLLGGHNSYPADQEVAEALIQFSPSARATAVENRRFLGRAVRYLAGQGVRQFLDIGAGLPTQDNVHQIAHRIAPDARVVYVDVDPAVVEQARTLLPPGGNATVVTGDLRQPDQLLGHPSVRELLDFREPIALLLVGVLYFVADSEDPYSAVARLRGALAPGSYLVLSHATGDVNPADQVAEGTKIYNDDSSTGLTVRSRAQVEGFLTGLDLVDPGMVLLPEWRPDGGVAPLEGAASYGAVGQIHPHADPGRPSR